MCVRVLYWDAESHDISAMETKMLSVGLPTANCLSEKSNLAYPIATHTSHLWNCRQVEGRFKMENKKKREIITMEPYWYFGWSSNLKAGEDNRLEMLDIEGRNDYVGQRFMHLCRSEFRLDHLVEVFSIILRTPKLFALLGNSGEWPNADYHHRETASFIS